MSFITDFSKVKEECKKQGIHVNVFNIDLETGLVSANQGNGIGKMFHINIKTCKPAYNERYDFVDKFSEGLAGVTKGHEAFHILPNGQPAYPLQGYFDVGTFHDGQALVRKDGKWAKINKQGRVITLWSESGGHY